jgi:hypothetical protein
MGGSVELKGIRLSVWFAWCFSEASLCLSVGCATDGATRPARAMMVEKIVVESIVFKWAEVNWFLLLLMGRQILGTALAERSEVIYLPFQTEAMQRRYFSTASE